MYSNIDHAITSVIERGDQLTIANVFSAYFQRVVACELPEGISSSDTDTITRVALFSFERAMDKYPMPSKPLKPKKTKNPKISSPSAPADLPTSNHTATARKLDPSTVPVGSKMYSAEVAQLRWDYYQQAMLRATDDLDAAYGCTCLSCGSLVAMREQMLASEHENGMLQDVGVPVRPRRVRKTKKRTIKKTQHARAVPFDPYAPSTSAAAAL